MMRITEINLARRDSDGAVQLASLSPQLNVFFGGDGAGKTSLASLAAQLLYGKRPFLHAERQSQHFAQQQLHTVEGSLHVQHQQGELTLRRHDDGTQQGRLTVAAANGAAADQDTIQSLLAGLSPRLLSRSYAIDFAHPPRIEDLLNGELAGAVPASGSPREERNFQCLEHGVAAYSSEIDRRKVDALAHRRDEVARQIEQQIAGRRGDSASLEREIAEVDRKLQDKRQLADDIEAQLRRANGELATIESRLRYFSMEATLRGGPRLDSAEHQAQLAELDAEISRCRQMLSDLQSRDALLRRDLATVHADGTADNSASLADQRVTVGTLERLLDDLDAETALLARAHEPGRCIAPEAHAQMTPVVELLRQQVYTLCGQLTEQERAARRRQLHAESRHLARSQSDLSEQLEHLLERRQALTHEAQLAGQPVMLLPQTPVARHCQCERHGEFIGQSEAMLLGNVERGRYEHDANQDRDALRRRCEDLTNQSERLEREIAELEACWERLQQQRADLVGKTSVDALREELRGVEEQLQHALQRRTTAPAVRIGGWRASDILAQLSDGRLTQIRIARDQRTATIVDQAGRTHSPAQLHAGERDQACLAISLAIVSSYASRGIRLPLILDEPFLHQDAAAAAAMAGVLEEFARQGNQLLAFTGNRDARRRFESLGVEVRSIEQQATAPAPQPAAFRPSVVEETSVRVVREAIDGNENHETSPQLRVTGWSPADDEHEVYYLTSEAPLGEFPVLGAETNHQFAALGIHTVAQLLAADPATVATGLAHTRISATTVRLWQTHMSLMCFVPGVSLDDAQVLAASGIDSPEDLSGADLQTLEALIAEFLASERGRRYAAYRNRYSRSALAAWQSASLRNRNRWQPFASHWSSQRPLRGTQSHHSHHSHHSRHDGAARASTDRERSKPASKQRQKAERRQAEARQKRSEHSKRELRFFLSRDSEVVDAPSIGPKTAERLVEVGVRSVADLLNADAESTAAELGVSHITAEAIAAWQHQARLVCCIPELRGFGAQLLVGCGLTEPRQIARASEEELFRKVRNFARSKAGQRILRDGKGPNQEKVAEWIECAGHMRSLEAA